LATAPVIHGSVSIADAITDVELSVVGEAAMPSLTDSVIPVVMRAHQHSAGAQKKPAKTRRSAEAKAV
jgi:hypothetical protein